MDPTDKLDAVQLLKEQFRELIELQKKLIRAAVFGGMTPQELEEYDDRQRRIAELIERVGKLEQREAD